MNRRLRISLAVAGSLAGMLVVLLSTGLLVLRSDWFRERVRQLIIGEAEKATGGKIEIGSFRFHWTQLRAEVTDFVIHGTEPAGSAPLLRAANVSLTLKISSVLRRHVDLEALNVDALQVHLIVDSGGSTNIPRPKVRNPGTRAVETILDLAIHRFELRRSSFEVNARGRLPFHARGENLRAQFNYDFNGPRYQGVIAIQPLHANWGGKALLPVNVELALAMEKKRVELSRGRLAMGKSEAEVAGALDDLSTPHGSFRYSTRVALDEVGRMLALRPLESGAAQLGGTLRIDGSQWQAVGNMHATGVTLRIGDERLQDLQIDGAVEGDSERIDWRGVRLAGTLGLQSRGRAEQRIPLEGRIEAVTLRGESIDAAGFRVAALGGDFRGNAAIRSLEQFRVEGRVDHAEIARAVGLFTRHQVAWNGLASGPVRVEGSLKHPNQLTASGQLNIAPFASGPPVHGNVEATYTARGGTVDVGRSHVELPHTRVNASGVLGRSMRVRMESTDLSDLLPLAGDKPLPVSLKNGSAMFEGTVTGELEAPDVTGQVRLTHFVYEGREFDSLSSRVAVSLTSVTVRNGVVTRGTMRAAVEGSAALQDWKLEDSSAVRAEVGLRSADLKDLLALAGHPDMEAAGTLTSTAQITGTAGDPHIGADVHVERGQFSGEPFDRLDARVDYSGTQAEVTGGKVVSGGKQLDLNAKYHYTRGNFAEGRLAFQMATNNFPLDQVRAVQKRRPGIAGDIQVKVDGTVDVHKDRVDIVDLRADVAARGLRMQGRPLGDARLAANTRGQLLEATLESDFAQSVIKGHGQWRLADPYQGTAQITFSRLDFTRLKQWLSAATPAGELPVRGFAEGKISIDGPLIEPDEWTALLEIPKLEIGPEGNAPVPAGNPGEFILRNAGPIRVSMRKSVARIESARFAGRATDLSVTGTVSLQDKSPLELDIAGRIDLAVLQDFNHDIYSTGFLVTKATVRGPFNQPQINGRLEMRNAAFNMADFSTGLYNANGVIVFDGARATIQSMTAESGGGKVALSGFAAYGGATPVFRILATAEEVRYRTEGISAVANADLNWTGTIDRSLLAGNITLVRVGFNPRSDFSSVLAKSAEPVRTPSAKTGLVGGVQFDVQIESAPDISFQSDLAQDIQAEGSLHLRGTASNPALLGRVVITQGQINFFGTKYDVNQGTISFYNPVKIEPILNVDLETKARGIDVTLTVSGPLNKLNISPRSDPPLQFSEIVALLATGRTPTSDPTRLAQQSTNPQGWQQMGAAALVGQAIANPVAGRLQRFFGVTRLKIDPTLSGVENNPQARLTIEQQVTRDITFTYITNVTSSNPLVVRVEWALNRQWSAVAVREENGLFGLDFLYKARFK